MFAEGVVKILLMIPTKEGDKPIQSKNYKRHSKKWLRGRRDPVDELIVV